MGEGAGEALVVLGLKRRERRRRKGKGGGVVGCMTAVQAKGRGRCD